VGGARRRLKLNAGIDLAGAWVEARIGLDGAAIIGLLLGGRERNGSGKASGQRGR